MIKKIASLKGHIDCPFCLSYLEWNDIDDIHVFNGNKYVTCPQCNKNILLDDKKDYWDNSGGVLPDITEEDEGKILQVVDGIWSKVENSDASEKTWTTVFDGEVITTAASGAPFAATSINPSKAIKDDIIKVTFDGEKYECVKVLAQQGSYAYGGVNSATGLPDFSEYPFMVGIFDDSCQFLTEQAGTFSVKIETQSGSGLSTANVTITNNTGTLLSCGIPCADTFSSYGFGITAILQLPEGATPYLVPLYETHAFLYIDYNTEQVDVELTGNIILHPTDPVFIVTGDGTITLKFK